MKHRKKLRRWMKELLEMKNLNPEKWLFVKNLPERLIIVHKISDKQKTIVKG